MEIDIVALSAVAGGVASIAQWVLHRVLRKVGLEDDLTPAMKQFVIAPALALAATAVYIGLYSGISFNEADLGAVFIGVITASQLTYAVILPKLTN